MRNASGHLILLVVSGGVLLAGLFAIRFSALSGSSSLYAFVESMEDLRPGGHKDNFGWGGMQKVFAAAQELSPVLHPCRQYHRVGEPLAYTFDVKIDPAAATFRVVGISRGADRNPEFAACLRDRIAAARVAALSTLKPTADDTYALRISVHGNVGSDLP